ncbi:unnamed protein product [Litomosoides sigmodontis]|uniref:Uncharacterized protein n=1 Tax=Litomosoides sigmodontis TaxID=42156 RepID=A0A3P6U0G8_LITSI|nr:unnamed protein product [Litomosoides sigmodontis]
MDPEMGTCEHSNLIYGKTVSISIKLFALEVLSKCMPKPISSSDVIYCQLKYIFHLHVLVLEWYNFEPESLCLKDDMAEWGDGMMYVACHDDSIIVTCMRSEHNA